MEPLIYSWLVRIQVAWMREQCVKQGQSCRTEPFNL